MSTDNVTSQSYGHRFSTSDSLRGILLDTLPVEVPVIFSNVGAHRNLTSSFRLRSRQQLITAANLRRFNDSTEWLGHAVSKHLQADNHGIFELPYIIDTTTTENRRRVISLPHFRSQVRNALFLHENSHKIIYYCGQSDCSLRAPNSVGPDSIRVSPEAEQEQRPGLTQPFTVSHDQASSVDTTDTRWVKQVFTYRKYKRLYQFFESTEFFKLELQFPILLKLDVQSAFASIYTHSIAWAVRGKPHCKSNKGSLSQHDPPTRSEPFASEFDRIMQRSNWNETNGILVGPEVSRIFAEVIFQQIDNDATEIANERLLITSSEEASRSYALFRYVDDYFVFARSLQTADIIKDSIERSLEAYKLRLNNAKTEYLERPLVSSEGQLSFDISGLLKNRFDLFDGLLALPADHSPQKRGVALRNWWRGFLEELRYVCKLHSGGVAIAVSRVPAALREKAFSLLREGEDLSEEKAIVNADLSWTLVQLCGYMISLRNTEAGISSFCAIVLVCLRLNNLAGGRAARTSQIERLFERCCDILRTMSADIRENERQHHLPLRGNLAMCNLIACLSEFESPFRLSEEELHSLLRFDPGSFTEERYFELISIYFYLHKTNSNCSTTSSVVTRILQLIQNDGLQHAGLSFAVFDMLSCPLVGSDEKRDLLDAFANAVGATQQYIGSMRRKHEVLDLFNENPWFTDWNSSIQMLQRFRRRTATQAY